MIYDIQHSLTGNHG